MIKFKISIAKVVVEITALYDSTKDFCKDYLTELSPDFSIEITDDDIEFERNRSKNSSSSNCNSFSREYLETLAVYRKIAEKMPYFNAFLFHASAVEVDGVAFLFTAKSGTGKSTHVELYRQKFGSKAKVINDDKPIILIEYNKPYVCGTPWSGKRNLNENKIVPVKALCILRQDKINTITKINKQDAMVKLLSQAYRLSIAEALNRFLKLFSIFLDSTDVYDLGCNKEPEAADISYEAIRN